MSTPQAAARHLHQGGLVVMPTETVYGLAANAGDAAAVAQVFAAKGRPVFDPLIVHIADAAAAWRVAVPNPQAEALAAAFWPGPLTLVLPRRPGVIADLVNSGLDTVAVRCPQHPLALELLRLSDLPLAAPSANLFGRISPTTIEHVADQFAEHGALLLDGGPCRVGIESTVLTWIPHPVILRPGGISAEALAPYLGGPPPVLVKPPQGAIVAPGLLASHYAPRKSLHWIPENQPWPAGAQWGVLAFGSDAPPLYPQVGGVGAVENLSPESDLVAAASRLFAAMRRLDAGPAQQLIARPLPAHGLGVAINDRLRRAAGLG